MDVFARNTPPGRYVSLPSSAPHHHWLPIPPSNSITMCQANPAPFLKIMHGWRLFRSCSSGDKLVSIVLQLPSLAAIETNSN